MHILQDSMTAIYSAWNEGSRTLINLCRSVHWTIEMCFGLQFLKFAYCHLPSLHPL